jgi:GNAT superfamily N-acetyltransferase
VDTGKRSAVEVTIRPTTLEDLADVARLYVALKDHHARVMPTTPRSQVPNSTWRDLAENALKDPEAPTFVAEAAGEIVAFMKLSFVLKPWGRSCEVDTMIVEEPHRSRGIGARLLREAEACAWERGAKGLRVDVLLDNYEGREFYERHGYEPLSVRYGKRVREPD